MLTINGLEKVKRAILNFAQADDAELNAILLQAVNAINKLSVSRSPQSEVKAKH